MTGAGPGTTAQTLQVTVMGQDYRVSVRRAAHPEPGADLAVPLVVCNGIGASLEVLQPFVDAIPAHVPVIRFDVPGVGGSPTPTLPYTIGSLAFAVGRILNRLGVGTVDIAGMSWGGGLAQQFALTNPRRCRRLALIGTATGAVMVPGTPDVLAKMATPRRYRDPAYARLIAPHVYGGTLRTQSEETADLLQKHLRLGSRRGYLFQLLALASWTSLPVLPLIRQPTIILAGTDDPIIPVANARVMHALLPHSQLHLYPDGHLALLTDPAPLVEIMGDFLW